jgi:hypothetical protein
VAGCASAPHAPSPARARNVLLNVYYDGAAEPAIRIPVGDFFGFSSANRPCGRC